MLQIIHNTYMEGERKEKIAISVNTYESIEDKELFEQILIGYKTSFNDSLGESAQLQECLDQEFLERVLKDQSFIKIVTIAKEKLIGCCIIATNPDHMKLAYANPDKFKQFIDTQNEKLYYVIAIFALAKVSGNMERIMRSLADVAMRDNATIGYDHSEKNSGLPNMIQAMAAEYSISKGRKLEDQEIGSQHFRLIRLNNQT